MRRVMTVFAAFALSVALAAPALAGGPPPRDDDGNRVRVTVIVDSTGLEYDSIVGPSLPANGPFQELYVGMDGNLHTEFGPGDQGYVGGRWKMQMEDGSYVYFSCPLLGNGSAS